MAVNSKYFYTTDLTSYLKQLESQPRLSLHIKDLDSIPQSMRYLSAHLHRLKIKAKVSKAQYIVDNRVVTILHLEAV